jgi:hypothetical protein
VNEYKYPNIVELTFPADGLEFELNRRIIGFHKSRHIQPRHGASDRYREPNLFSVVLCRSGDSLRFH